jgi:hypothetical protein
VFAFDVARHTKIGKEILQDQPNQP